MEHELRAQEAREAQQAQAAQEAQAAQAAREADTVRDMQGTGAIRGIEAVDATDADKIGLVVARGPTIVSKAALVFDTSVDDATKKATKHGQLAAAGLVPRDTA